MSGGGETRMTKAELLAKMQQGIDELVGYLMTLTPPQVTEPTDPAGWTSKDHLMHLAVWLDGMNALLEGKDRVAHMGLDREQWDSLDYDAMNDVIQKRHQKATLPEVREALMGAHSRMMAHVEAMSEDDLYQPYETYQPDKHRNGTPIIRWILANTFDHYDEHRGYIEIIVNNASPMDQARLLEKMQTGWRELNAYLDTLTPEQMTVPQDGGGWTIKDHVIHMAVWEDGMRALLDKQDRVAAMGVDREIWENHDTDETNDVIYRHNKDMPLDQVRATFNTVHEKLIAKIESMTTEDLYQPYGFYQPQEPREGDTRPIINWIAGNTYDHYEEHLPWMKAILAS